MWSKLRKGKSGAREDPIGVSESEPNYLLDHDGSIQHATPRGPKGDCAELEYISALLQSDDEMRLRISGSISAEEISVYLRSRHGLVVDEATVLRDVLGGGLVAWSDHKLLRVKESDGEYESQGGIVKDSDGANLMDLTEMAAAIIIPSLLRLKKRRDQRRQLLSSLASDEMITVRIFSDVLSLILLDATGSPDPQPLNAELVRKILVNFK